VGEAEAEVSESVTVTYGEIDGAARSDVMVRKALEVHFGAEHEALAPGGLEASSEALVYVKGFSIMTP